MAMSMTLSKPSQTRRKQPENTSQIPRKVHKSLTNFANQNNISLRNTRQQITKPITQTPPASYNGSKVTPTTHHKATNDMNHNNCPCYSKRPTNISSSSRPALWRHPGPHTLTSLPSPALQPTHKYHPGPHTLRKYTRYINLQALATMGVEESQ